MIGHKFVRIFLVITLIVSAHFIKPFSVNNFTNHFIESSNSFKSMLPASQGAGFDHANMLAITLNQILFGGELRNERIMTVASADMVMNKQSENHSSSDENNPPVKTNMVEILAKGSIRVESASLENARVYSASETFQVERVVDVASIRSKPVEPEVATETDAEASTTYFNASSPVVLPVVQKRLACTRLKLRPFTAEPLKMIPSRYHLLNQPGKVDCENREKKVVKFFTLVYLDKSILSILGCEREETESEAIESQPVHQESKSSEMQEGENFDLFITRPKAESCSIN